MEDYVELNRRRNGLKKNPARSLNERGAHESHRFLAFASEKALK